MGCRNGIVDFIAACICDRLPTWLGISHPGVPLLDWGASIGYLKVHVVSMDKSRYCRQN